MKFCQEVIIHICGCPRHSVAQLPRGAARGLSVRTYEEASMARGHLDYKHPEFVKTIPERTVWTK